MPEALVVFHGIGNHPLNWLLKPGFKHCFVVVADPDGYWVRVDGQAGRASVEVVAGLDFDAKSFYEGQGFTVVEVAKRGHVRFPVSLSNCVGMVKVVLGTNAPWVVTPYQLYKRLT